MNLYQVFSHSGPLAGNNRQQRHCPQCGVRFAEQVLARFERQRCERCGYVHHLNPAPGITMLIKSKTGDILIGRRRATVHCGGQWCLPGGYIEFEESFIDTAHREVREETGLAVRINGIVNVVSNHLDDGHHTLVIVLLGEALAGRPEPGDDLEELMWIDRWTHAGIDYAFEADQRIIDGYFAGNLQLLPIDARIE
ncbi:MAG: NUDIX domain-containing protein [Proteobacteria bacterium]|nr:NUDIX domain-containing protein [Pseudomonadota bacterium]